MGGAEEARCVTGPGGRGSGGTELRGRGQAPGWRRRGRVVNHREPPCTVGESHAGSARPPARLVSLLSGSATSNHSVALKRIPSEASVSLLHNAAISPFACLTLYKINGTRGRRGPRLMLRTAKMPGTKERLPSSHHVPGGSILSLCLGFPARVRCQRLDREAAGRGRAAPQSACRSLHLRLPRAPHPETLGVPGERVPYLSFPAIP